MARTPIDDENRIRKAEANNLVRTYAITPGQATEMLQPETPKRHPLLDKLLTPPPPVVLGWYPKPWRYISTAVGPMPFVILASNSREVCHLDEENVAKHICEKANG